MAAAQSDRAATTYGQPVLIGGSMGTASYVMAGTQQGMRLSFGSACHGAGRSMSRHAALQRYGGQHVAHELAARGILVRSPSMRGVAEEAPRCVQGRHRSGRSCRQGRTGPHRRASGAEDPHQRMTLYTVIYGMPGM